MTREYWLMLTSELLSDTRGGEAINLSLSGEKSTFLRFNNSKIRQSTGVEQYALEMVFQKDHRRIQAGFMLTGSIVTDLKMAQSLLVRAREEVSCVPADPHLVEMQNNGNSLHEHHAELPSTKEAIESIEASHQGIDHAGFYAGGPILRANRNSLGQEHWFSTETFFYDYSIFTKNADGNNKAVKGCYSQENWSTNHLQRQIDQKLYLLEPLQRSEYNLKKGSYRAYLAPEAVGELAGLLNWDAFNYATYRQGRSPFAKLAEGKEKLSTLLSLGENFDLGLAPRFNSLGEMAPIRVPVIAKGQLSNWLVNSRAAKEYSVESNAAESGFRSLDIDRGSLPEQEILQQLNTGVYVGNLHYANWSDIPNARVTGMTRYACFWVHNGEIVAPIQDMRFDESLYRLFGSELLALTEAVHLEPEILTYGKRLLGGRRLPGILLSDFRFTL